MTWIILLFVLGLLFIAVEVIIPGGILGAIGGLMMFGGCFMAFTEFGTVGGFIAIVAALGLSISTIYFEFKILPKTAIGRRAFLTKEVTGVSAAFGEEARALIGKSAEALTMLSPSGYIDIDGKRYEAFCQSGQIPAGTPLEVIGADSFRLIVSQTKTNQQRHD